MVYPEAPFQLGQHLRVVRHVFYCVRRNVNVKKCLQQWASMACKYVFVLYHSTLLIRVSRGGSFCTSLHCALVSYRFLAP
eukprot:4256368-Amphidinium_carterae.2